MRSVVMSDVAREAGVSQQTVSRVLHDHPSVRPETRARVNDAIERLGYRPNLAARSLAAGRSRTVGVLLMSQLSHGTAATFAAIADSARQEGYQLVVASAQDTPRARCSRPWTTLPGTGSQPRSSWPAA